ncbi:MAG: peptidylprolyl isomerase [Mycobacteriaceae bacterium]
MNVPANDPQPYPEDYPYQPYPNPYPYPYPYAHRPPPRTNALAIASLVCGFLFAPLAIVFGHISLSQIKKSGEDGRGLAIAGLVMGYIVTIGTILALVAGAVLLSWAARVVRDSSDPGGLGVPRQRTASPPLNGDDLPVFTAPAGLGGACAYPPTATPAVRPVRPPRSGAVPTDPPVVEATMLTADGAIGLRLDNGKAPCTVNSFVSLAQQGFFDNTDCHRLTDSRTLAVLQCGDPTGTGSGGPGYRFANEYPTNQYRPLDPALERPLTYPRGTLAMAAPGKDSNGSQFLIVYRDSKLPPTYTVFGQVDNAGLVTVDALTSGGIAGGADDGKPKEPIMIQSITIE